MQKLIFILCYVTKIKNQVMYLCTKIDAEANYNVESAKLHSFTYTFPDLLCLMT